MSLSIDILTGFLAAFLYVHAAAGALPSFNDVPYALRAATWTDVASEFHLVYSLTEECADVLRFGMPEEDERRVGLLPMSAITEDDYPCSGASPLSMVTETTIEQPGLMDAVGLSGMREAFENNVKAKALVDLSNNTTMIIGWHETDRACDTDVYPPSTLYLFLREKTQFVFTVVHGDQTETIYIPPNLSTLFIVPLGQSLCLFVDPKSDPSPVLLQSRDQNGNVQQTELRPEDSGSMSPIITSYPSPSLTSYPSAETPTAVSSPTQSPPMTFSASPVSSSTPAEPPISGAGGVTDVDNDDDDVVPSNDGNGAACFPGDSRVATAHGVQPSFVTMSSLRVGSRVVGASRSKTQVLLFTHSNPHARASFVRMTFADGGPALTLSPGHYVPLIDGSLRAANRVQPGDALIHALSHTPRRVVSVSPVCAEGLYNPQTMDGWLSVENTLVSTYTTAIHPRIAHTALSWAARFLSRYRDLASWLSKALTYGAPFLAALLPGGKQSIAYT